MRQLEFRRFERDRQWINDEQFQDRSKGYDLGVIHMLGMRNRKQTDWVTVEDVRQSILNYNEEYPDEGFNDDIGYIAYSLMKCIEYGLVEIHMEEVP